MKTEIIEVTPELAEKWFGKNYDNRRLRAGVAERYAKDMREGRWTLTHQGLAFDTEGNLIDGQHRLWAVIETGLTIKFMITTGMDRKTRLNFDQNIVRSGVDALHFAAVPASRSLQGMIRQFMQGDDLGFKRLTNAEFPEVYKRYQQAFDFVVANLPPKQYIRQSPVMTAIARAYYHVDRDELKAFCRLLVDGFQTGSTERDRGVALLRDFLLRKDYGGSREIYLKTQRAIQAYIEHEEIKTLYACRKDAYPLPTEAQLKRGN